MDNDRFNDLIEIVDALADTLAKQNPANTTLRSIADRARKLFRASTGETDGGADDR